MEEGTERHSQERGKGACTQTWGQRKEVLGHKPGLQDKSVLPGSSAKWRTTTQTPTGKWKQMSFGAELKSLGCTWKVMGNH